MKTIVLKDICLKMDGGMKIKYISGKIYRLCLCGKCDRYILVGKKNSSGKEILTVKGHHLRLPEYKRFGKSNSFYGKQHSPEAKKKIGDKKYWSEERRLRISENHADVCGENNPNYGNHSPLTEDHKRKIGAAGKGRCFSEAHKRKISDANKGKTSWKKGLKIVPDENREYPFEWNHELKESIRDRDQRICQCCDLPERENNGRRLSVHHIDYNKKNLLPANLISLCVVCHVATNNFSESNKEKTKKMFYKKLEEKESSREIRVGF